MHGQQIRLFDDADLKLDRGHQQQKPGDATRFGVTNAIPKPNVIIAVKIGLRTQPNTPVRTSVVVSLGSTPMRHESPISSCAYTVAKMPIAAIDDAGDLDPRCVQNAQR